MVGPVGFVIQTRPVGNSSRARRTGIDSSQTAPWRRDSKPDDGPALLEGRRLDRRPEPVASLDAGAQLAEARRERRNPHSSRRHGRIWWAQLFNRTRQRARSEFVDPKVCRRTAEAQLLV